jgi:hypothetical protein
MADTPGEHSKDAETGKEGDKLPPTTGATLSKQDTENIIKGIMKRLTEGKGGPPSDPTKKTGK